MNECAHKFWTIETSRPQVGCWRKEECIHCKLVRTLPYILDPSNRQHPYSTVVYESTSIARFPFYTLHCLWCNTKRTFSSRSELDEAFYDIDSGRFVYYER